MFKVGSHLITGVPSSLQMGPLATGSLKEHKNLTINTVYKTLVI